MITNGTISNIHTVWIVVQSLIVIHHTYTQNKSLLIQTKKRKKYNNNDCNYLVNKEQDTIENIALSTRVFGHPVMVG